MAEKLIWEKELLGLYISSHPFTEYKKHISEFVTPLRKLSEFKNEQQVTVAGIITRVQKIMTRTNKNMLFVKIEDDGGALEILVFPNLLKETSDIWVDGKGIISQGKLSDKDQETKLLANTAFKLSLKNIGAVISKFKNAAIGGSGEYFQGGPSKYSIQRNLNITTKCTTLLKPLL